MWMLLQTLLQTFQMRCKRYFLGFWQGRGEDGKIINYLIHYITNRKKFTVDTDDKPFNKTLKTI
jgi:hypothetical protein